MVSRKGLSDIVTNVLIILLVLVAVGIIWAFLRPTITDSASQLQGVTTSYGSLLSIDARSITLDEQTTTLSFVVERGRGEGEMIGLKIVVEDTSGNTEVFEDTSVLAPLETKRINIDYSNASLTGRPTKVSVVPIFSIGGGEERFGSQSEVLVIPTSSGGSIQQCLNNIREGGEVCDGTDLASQDCTDFNSPSGSPFYFATTLSCAGTCDAFVTSACTGWCGDGSQNGPEICEGSQIDPTQDQCNEISAPSGYGNYYSGIPTCTTTCTLNTGNCNGYCGNSFIDSGSNEECDASLFARSCAGFVVPGTNERGHYYNGTFQASDCTISTCQNTYALAGCADSGAWCGDGITQSVYGEDCDGTAGCSTVCTTGGAIPSQCGDGRDNDGDGWIDFRGIRANFTQFGDPGCSGQGDNSETNTGGAIVCANDLDDDGDGKIDGLDFGCLTNTDNSESVV